MANTNEQTQLKSTEEVNFKMRTSFSWDTAFFTSDGFLDDEELSSIIEGGELRTIEELENLEAILFQEFQASTQVSTGITNITDSSINSSSGRRDFKEKKVTGAGGPHKDAPIRTPLTRSSPSSGGSPGNNVKTLARKSNANPPLKTLPGIRTKNKLVSVNTCVSRTSPASPVSPGSPDSTSSTFSDHQRPKRIGGTPRRSMANNERPSATNARRNNDHKASKPAVSLMLKTQPRNSLKIKPTPVISHPSSPPMLFNSSSCSTSESSSCTVDQRSKSRGIKGSIVHHVTKPALKNHPIGQTNRKQPAKTAAAADTGLKPSSPITKKQTNPKTKASSSGTEDMFTIISPELLDLKGKINALKMEIDRHKKDRCNKMVRAASDGGTPFAINECSL